ncbi:MAG: Dipeptidyl aminopeptidase BIII [Chlamydiae bacterium]|nr:Dipeptidyl aminopeptidase BIII [Chlamydiota bacterium]
MRESVSPSFSITAVGHFGSPSIVITTLAALAFHNIFAGGTSYYGVSDLELLYEDTHKFEAQYTDILVGPYPDAIDLIRERSPTNHVEKISAHVLLLQGDEDKIVPPNQSFKIYEALKEKGIPVGMIFFEGEGHGFRKAPNIKRSLDAELYFYSQILGIDLPQAFEEPPVSRNYFKLSAFAIYRTTKKLTKYLTESVPQP